MLHQGLLPDGITYIALVSACEKGALRQRALEALEAMLHQGLLPDGITYNALVSACEKGALQLRTSQLSAAKRHQGFLPDGISLQRFGHCLREGCAAAESP